MATRGRKPKPPDLHVISGTHRPDRHGNPEDLPAVEDRPEGLEPHRKLTAPQQKLWDTFIKTTPWLSEYDVPRAYMWVCLQAEYDRKPAAMVAARIAQLRALGSELGLEPAARARLGAGLKGKGGDDEKGSDRKGKSDYFT